MTLASPPADAIRRRLNAAAWGLLLAWTGGLLLAPGDVAMLWHVWLVGIGVILVGAGLVALSLGVRPGEDTWILGAAGIVSGSGGLVGVPLSAIGLALLFFGLAFLVSVGRASIRRPTGP